MPFSGSKRLISSTGLSLYSFTVVLSHAAGNGRLTRMRSGCCRGSITDKNKNTNEMDLKDSRTLFSAARRSWRAEKNIKARKNIKTWWLCMHEKWWKYTRERPGNKAKKKMKSYVRLSLLTQKKHKKITFPIPTKKAWNYCPKYCTLTKKVQT